MKRHFAWKRLVALLLTLAMLATGLAMAEAPAQEAAQDELPSVGETMHGFTVAGVYPYESMNAQAVEFTHDKTGATLLWIVNDSTDRAFVVGFHTLVTNDKGVPHVFEHATISGSEKYPNPNLFMSMLNGTYNTYMNASTARTYTDYPSSSLSEAQLLKYVDFYLDGVYHPLVVSDERLMRREAYRYELPSADAELTLQGTVYSEMLGALTQERSALDDALRLAYPGSAVASETGGVPGVIETMTHQDLIDFHDTYYHPSNSLMVLYGDLDVEPFLALIDGYLSEFDREEVDVSDSGYTPLTGDVEQEVAFPVGESDAAETYMFYAIPLPGMDVVELDQFNLALGAMVQNGQPFDRLMKERLPGVSVVSTFNIEGPCPCLLFRVTGASAGQKDDVRDAIREGIAATLEQGLDPELLAASVLASRMRQAKLADDTSAVDAASNIISLWGMAGDPLAFLEDDRFQMNLQSDLDNGAFDAVLEKYLADPAATALLVSTGEPGLKEEQDAELKQKLADRKAAMSDSEIAALVAQHDELERWNAENEASVSLAQVQVVDAQTLPEEIVAHTAADADADGLRVVSSEVDSDLMDIAIYLDASAVPADELDEAALAVALLGMVSTENYDATALNSKIAATAGAIATMLTSIYQEDWSYAPYAKVSFSCFPEDLDAAFDLVEEQLLRTKYDPAEVQAMCAAYAPMIEASIDPYDYAHELSEASLSEAHAYDLRVGNAGLAQTMKRVAEMDEAELGEFIQRMKDMIALLCNRNGMILTVAGSAENVAAATEQTQSLRAQLDDAAHEAVDYSSALAMPRNVAATYGSDAMYNIAAMRFANLGMEYSGKLSAFTSAVTSLVLIPLMRNTYSVYTPVFSISRFFVSLDAYRDPRLRETFTEVLPSLGDAVRALDITQEELDGYITKAYSALAMPKGPFTGADMAIEDALHDRNSFERTLARMRELKETTPEDITAYADILDKLAADGIRTSVGSPQLIQGASDLFDEVDTWMTE